MVLLQEKIPSEMGVAPRHTLLTLLTLFTLFMLFILLYIAVMTTRAPAVLKMERKNQENIVKIFRLRKRMDKKMK